MGSKMKIFTLIYSLLITVSGWAQSIQPVESVVNYEPTLHISYLSPKEGRVAELKPELVMEFDVVESDENVITGRLNISLHIYGNINVVDLTSLAEITQVEALFQHQLTDVEILLRNRFGSFLTRLNGKRSEDPQNLMNVVLEEWNEHWEQSQELWKPYYREVELGVRPKIETKYIERYRRYVMGNHPFQKITDSDIQG